MAKRLTGGRWCSGLGVTSLSRRERPEVFKCAPTKTIKYEDGGWCCQFYCCAYAVVRGKIGRAHV